MACWSDFGRKLAKTGYFVIFAPEISDFAKAMVVKSCFIDMFICWKYNLTYTISTPGIRVLIAIIRTCERRFVSQKRTQMAGAANIAADLLLTGA